MVPSKAAYWALGDYVDATHGNREESILSLLDAEFGRMVIYPGSLN